MIFSSQIDKLVIISAGKFVTLHQTDSVTGVCVSIIKIVSIFIRNLDQH